VTEYSSGIPTATASDALRVFDGPSFVGRVVERDRCWFSFNADGILMGEFCSFREAVRAIPRRISARKTDQPPAGPA
jgi:hypothetical protein